MLDPFERESVNFLQPNSFLFGPANVNKPLNYGLEKFPLQERLNAMRARNRRNEERERDFFYNLKSQFNNFDDRMLDSSRDDNE